MITANQRSPITVALAKGALLKDSVRRFQAAGLDFSDLLEEDNRLLMVPSRCGTARALLVRNADVPVYVAYGQAQLGVVGYDVLREHQLPVAQLVDLGFGGCRMAVAVKASSGYRRAADLPAHCRVASKFTRCAEAFFEQLDLPVELIHLTGSVELGPITGMSEAIVDLVATGRTLRDNGLVAIEDLFTSSARLIGHPLALRLDDGGLQGLVERIATIQRPAPKPVQVPVR
ncbi:ATP phosphoribosyltransferase [Cyanobium sp. AMD-g]|uniref:ATP phosphoribosyltransferase n=1 Tax=Cyanobium sp. AMD-g TaxID=2823699 RepID=UPI0020CCA452|nr:ATP phosphoribosyltransferase [Cyanobium sp. AMD-g]MCP9929916.1 ATP phosphoribosyltransferase [Cyanobium sp. AMD-g]